MMGDSKNNQKSINNLWLIHIKPDSFVRYKSRNLILQMHKENIELKTLNEEAFEKHKHIDLHLIKNIEIKRIMKPRIDNECLISR